MLGSPAQAADLCAGVGDVETVCYQMDLHQAEKLAPDKPGLRWLRYAVLRQCRRNEELKKALTDEAARLVRTPTGADDMSLALSLVAQASEGLSADETLALLDALRPVYARQAGRPECLKTWRQQRLTHLQQAGRSE